MKKISREKNKKEHLYQGRLHSVKGEYKEAVEEYRRALEIDPNYKPAEVNLSFISYMKRPLKKDSIPSNKYMKLPKRHGEEKP